MTPPPAVFGRPDGSRAAEPVVRQECTAGDAGARVPRCIVAGRRPAVVRALRDFDPGWFALVMATGILGAAADALGVAPVARAFTGAAAAAYAAVWGMTLARCVRFPDAAMTDLAGRRAPGFLTMVAATSVLGDDIRLAGGGGAATVLWIAAAALWCAVVAALGRRWTVRRPAVRRAGGGAWLLLVVATQSLAGLQAMLGPGPPGAAPWGPAVALALFGAGCLWYGALIVPVARRMLRGGAAEFALSYWLTMGAAAISTLSGALVLQRAAGPGWPREVAPAVTGAAVACWAVASAWIPIVTVFMVRWIATAPACRAPMPEYWTFVFPLGMYATATHALASAAHLRMLDVLPPAFAAAGLGAWAVGVAVLFRRAPGGPPGC
jgi:tellurite resistance protein TehA-like permease